MKKLFICFGLFTAVFGVLGCDFSPAAKEKSEARFAIDYCRDSAKKDANGNKEMESLLMGACDILAKEFKQKYGVDP